MPALTDNDYQQIERALDSFTGPFHRTVSIVLPVYNGKELLARALAGLKLQTYPSSLFEVIVADDGSSDGVADWLANFKAPFEVKFVTQPHTGFGLARIRNKAIRQAGAEVIVALDGDMIPMPEFLDKHLRWFHVSDRVATIGFRRYVRTDGIEPAHIERRPAILDELEDVDSASNTYPKHRRVRELREFFRHPAPYTLFHGCNVAYRRADALAVGLYDDEFDGHWGYEDIEFGYRLWKHGLYFIDEREALALHQENAILTNEDRIRHGEVNRLIAERKMPEYFDFLQQLNTRSEPWWNSAGAFP